MHSGHSIFNIGDELLDVLFFKVDEVKGVKHSGLVGRLLGGKVLIDGFPDELRIVLIGMIDSVCMNRRRDWTKKSIPEYHCPLELAGYQSLRIP